MKLHEIFGGNKKTSWDAFASYHYSPDSFNPACRVFLATMEISGQEVLVGFAACLPLPSGTLSNAWRSHKVTVFPPVTSTGIWGADPLVDFVLPADFQDEDAWKELADALAMHLVAEGKRYFCNAGDAPPELVAYRNDPASGWRPTSKNGKRPRANSGDLGRRAQARHVNQDGLVVSHEWVGKSERLDAR